ncbi:MAG: SDR family NAD(P)-dependent oxidoreductase, partial [Gammaproteobacteria bacterium]|nr:SDR family NAD(P)-dependent oxidoreductase [Gammaproteobacteria bacterium]
MSTKVALITGAAQRIGAAIARKLHANGYHVVIHYNHSRDAASDLALELNQQRANSAYCIQADLTDIAVIDGLVSQIIEKSSRLDVLINNASTFFPTEVGDITPSQVTNLFATNMIAPLFLSQACAPYLKKTNGCIINMCDIHGKKPLSSHTV